MSLGKVYMRMEFNNNKDLLNFLVDQKKASEKKKESEPVKKEKDFFEELQKIRNQKTKGKKPILTEAERIEADQIIQERENEALRELGINGIMTETYDINQLRAIYPKAANTTITIGNGGLSDTINAILKTINYNYKKMLPLAEKLQADTLEQTAFNIWHFLKTQTEYQKDKAFVEELRTPQRLIADAKGDCDDYSIFAASILKALGYNPYLYIVAFNNSDAYAHIYAGVENIVLDGVMNEFDTHPEGITKTMIVNLNGQRKEFFRSPKLINITSMLLQQLSGLPYAEQTNIIDLELERLSGLSDLNEIETEDLQKVRTLKLLEGDGLRQFLSELMPIAGIDEDFNIVVYDEETANEIDNLYDEFESLSGLGDIDGLGKLFDKLKATVKKVNTKIKEKIKKDFEKFKVVAKKVSTAVKKVSFAPARGAFLLLLKMNLFGWASRLWLSYLPDAKVKEFGMNPVAFKKLVEFRKKFEDFWEKGGGDKKAIFAAVSGRGQKKAGKQIEKLSGLGVVTAAVAGGSVAVASPFLVFLKSIWGGVKSIFKNLFKKGGLKEGAGQIKDAIVEYREAVKDTDTEQDELLQKAYADGGKTFDPAQTETETDPTKTSLIIPAIAAVILLSLF